MQLAVVASEHTRPKEYSGMDAHNLAWWYWLTSIKWLGPAYARELLEAFGDPESVYHATKEDLAQSVKLQSRTLASIESAKERLPHYQDVAKRQVRISEATGARILTLHDPDYPELLRRQHKQAPPLINIQGGLNLIRPRAVAVVGTRSPSSEAAGRVRTLSARLVEGGSPVVAGMAKGIDAAAHSGALDSSGMTIGVLGCGLDRVYPPENSHLFVETRRRGLLISQFPFGYSPSPANLRQRNKLIVALSEAVVIAESDIQGGAMIAARAAVEQGRNLFVLGWPNMDIPTRAGTRRLLESKLARAVDGVGGDALFESPAFRGGGAPPARAWEAAFPEFQRSRSRSRKRGGSGGKSESSNKRDQKRPVGSKRSVAVKRA